MSTTRVKLASALASIGVLAIGWQVGTGNGQAVSSTATTSTTAGTTASGTTASGTTARQTTSATASTSATATSATSAAASASGLTDGTFTGATATNRYGSVTVTVTVSGGRITNVTAKTIATDDKSAQINARAVPVLKSEVIAAQSAAIANVSGATYTTRSYVTSLQSALDKAGA